MKKYLIIDKNTMSRESLSSLIYDSEDDAIVHEYESLSQILNSGTAHDNTDFIAYNATFEKVSQTKYFSRPKELAPNCKCLFIIENNYSVDIESLPDHVLAVVTVNSQKSEIVTAIKSMKIGQRYIGKHVQRSNGRLNNNSQDKFPTLKYRFANEIKNKLTTRQCEVLDYMVKGYANKLIAYELGVSEGTVKLHVSSILRALKVTNRTEAAMRAGQFLNMHAH